LRRIIIIGTAVAVLVGAAVAYAADFNNYSGSKLAFSGKTTLGMVETLKANAPQGDRAAPLTDIKVTIYGATLNGAKFPKCTDSMIEANKTKYDGACPSGSRIGSGPVHAVLGPSTTPSTSGEVNCDTVLHVYNGGQSTQVFFFTTQSATSCGGLTTGSTAPYDGHISHAGKNLVIDVPLPPDVSNKVGNQNGFYGSLIQEVLTFTKSTRTVHGKQVGYMQSTGCKGGKRPYSIKFTSQNYQGQSESSTITGSASC
jgi:hypothetical protein